MVEKNPKNNIACEIWNSNFIVHNKVLLKHSSAYAFYIVEGSFHAKRAELSSCDRDYMACKT